MMQLIMCRKVTHSSRLVQIYSAEMQNVFSHAIKPFSADKEEKDYLKRIFNYKKVERLHPHALFFKPCAG